MKKLIHEIHRRSLWQVLGLYLVGSWVALQVVEQLAEAAGLPAWVRPLALALLIIGFPIVIATAFVQEGLSTRESEVPPPSLADVGEVRPDPAPGPRRAEALFTWRNAIGGGVVALAVWGLVALGWVFLGGAGPEGVAPTQANANPSQALLPQGDERRKSIAVLPFRNLSADAENAFFADGVHESVLTQLSKIADLRVLSRASMIRYRDTDLTIQEIAEQVGAGAVLQGSVQRAGDDIRISTQLIDPDTEETLWADQYDGRVEEIFDFQSDVALKVANELQATLSPRETQAIMRPATSSVTALDFYVQGRLAYDEFRLEDNEEAIRLFREAIAIDSSFALAWAGLADGFLQRVQFYGYPIEWADSGEVTAERALILDPELPEGFNALGFAYSQKGRQRDAMAEWERAVELNPNQANATNNIGVSHTQLGDQAEALRWFKRAFMLDPNNVLSRLNVAATYTWLGEYEIAQRWFDQARLLTPDEPNVPWYRWFLDVYKLGPEEATRRLASVYEGEDDVEPRVLAALADGAMMAGDASGAAEHSRRALEAIPEGGAPFGFFDGRITRAWALSSDGLSGEALEILANVGREYEELIADGAEGSGTLYGAAQVYALRGARDQAIEAFARAFEGGYT